MHAPRGASAKCIVSPAGNDIDCTAPSRHCIFVNSISSPGNVVLWNCFRRRERRFLHNASPLNDALRGFAPARGTGEREELLNASRKKKGFLEETINFLKFFLAFFFSIPVIPVECIKGIRLNAAKLLIKCMWTISTMYLKIAGILLSRFKSFQDFARFSLSFAASIFSLTFLLNNSSFPQES